MPNISGHFYAASSARGELSPQAMLGTVVKDFAGMYRDAFQRKVKVRYITDELEQGVALHNLTDITFDTRPELPVMTQLLAADFTERGIEPLAARLSAHYLADIMVDVALLKDPDAKEVIAGARDVALGGLGELRKEGLDPGLSNFIEDYFTYDRPARYLEPGALATMAYHRLRRRALTPQHKQQRTLKAMDVPTVTELLDERSEEFHRLGMSAMLSTVEILRTAESS